MVNNTESGTDSIESAGSMVTCVPHLEKEISVVEGQDTIDRVEKELAVIVGDFDFFLTKRPDTKHLFTIYLLRDLCTLNNYSKETSESNESSLLLMKSFAF